MSGTIAYNDQYIPEGRPSYYNEEQRQQQQQHLLQHRYQHQQLDQEESRADATNPNTLYQLKSFIRDNLTQGGSFNSNGSSEGSLDHDISWNSPSPSSSSSSLDRGQQQTPEPQPLTRSNVTVHDTLWRKDGEEDPEHINRDYQEYRLTPPLSSLGRDINDKLNNQHWAELMQASEKAYESDHSSSQDTMIIRTEEEGINEGLTPEKTNQIPFSSYALQSSYRSPTTQHLAVSSSDYNYHRQQRGTAVTVQSFVDNRDNVNLKPGIKRRPSLGQIRRQNATTTRLELSSGPLSPVRSDGIRVVEESQSANRNMWRTSEVGNDVQTSSYDYPHTGQGLTMPGDSKSSASSPAAATAMYVTSPANSGDGDQGYNYVDASRGSNLRDYSQEISRDYQPHPAAATTAAAAATTTTAMENIYSGSGADAERQYNIENTQSMTPLQLEVPAKLHQPSLQGQPKGARNTEDDKDDGYDSPDALSSDAGSSSSVNSASPTDRSTTSTATAAGGTQSIQTLELDRVQQSTPTPHKTKSVTFGGVETRIYDVEPPSPRPRLLLRPAKIAIGSSAATKPTSETSAADRLKTNFGYVDRGKIPSFRGMNAALRRQAFQQSPQNQTEDSLEDKLKQLTLGNSDSTSTEAPITPNQQQQHTGRYSDDHRVYGYHANLDKQSQGQASRAVAPSMAQHSMYASPPIINTAHSQPQPVNDSIRFSHASRPDDVNWQRAHEATPSRQTTPHTNVSRSASSSPYEVAIPGPSGAATPTTVVTATTHATTTVGDRNQAYRTRQRQLEHDHLGTQRRELESEHSTQRGMYPRDSTYARSPQVQDSSSSSSSSRPVWLSGRVPLLEKNKTSPDHLSSPSGNRPVVYTDERFSDSGSDPRGQNTDRYRVDARQGQSGMIPLSDNMLHGGSDASKYSEPLSPTQRMLKAGLINENSNYIQSSSSLKPRSGMVKSSSDYDSLSSVLAQPVVHPPAPKRSMSQSTPSLVSSENIYGYHQRGGQGQGRRSLAYDDYGTTSKSPASANSSPDRSPAHQPSVKTSNSVLPPPKQTKLYYTPKVEPEGTDVKLTRTIINDLALKQAAAQVNNTQNPTDEDSSYINKNQTQSIMTRLNELRQSQARIKRPSPTKSSPPQSETKQQTHQGESPYAHLLRHKPILAEDAEATKQRRLSSSNVYHQHHSMDRRRPNSDQTAMDWRAGADLASRSPPMEPLTESEMSYPITNPRRAHRAAGIWSQDSPTSPLSPHHPTSPQTVSPPGGHPLHNSPPYQRSSTASYDRSPVANEDTTKKNMIYTTAADLFKMLDS